MRTDAQRNLGRVLEAAAEVFAERGPDASVDEIARRAGVGHATVFRRFPTKDALIAAVAEERLRELRALADEALAADDPGAGFFDFAWAACELQMRNRGAAHCVQRLLASGDALDLQRTVEKLTKRAQAAGAVRRDVRAADVPVLMRAALRAAPEHGWRRYVAVVLDGLRPPKTDDSTT